MPQHIICEHCGTVLYAGLELKPPDEVIQQYNKVCPRCGKKLLFGPERVGIRKIE
jgi:DNA-directed RNA polymerase subunit RPC12/RpoP